MAVPALQPLRQPDCQSRKSIRAGLPAVEPSNALPSLPPGLRPCRQRTTAPGGAAGASGADTDMGSTVKKRRLNRKSEFVLGAMMIGAIKKEDYELAADIKSEVDRRIEAGTLDWDMVGWVVGGESNEDPLAKLAFTRG